MDERSIGVSLEDTSSYEHAWVEWVLVEWVTIGMRERKHAEMMLK